MNSEKVNKSFARQVKYPRMSVVLSMTAANAVLYWIFSYLTSSITLLGIAQFRPAVVIPALFATLFGPWVGGVGAAVGTFINSFFVPTGPALSLVAGVPGNFAAFYLLGFLTHRKFSWGRVYLASIIALFVGNLVAAIGVAFFFMFVNPIWATLSLEQIVTIVIVFVGWWIITMFPFIAVIYPFLIRAVSYAAPQFVPSSIVSHTLRREVKSNGFVIAFFAAGIIFLITYAVLLLPPLGASLESVLKSALIAEVMKLIYLISGSTFLIISGVVMAYQAYRVRITLYGE